jgi:hypothetical protein
VPLIHEKDEVIGKYEDALWKMEHRQPIDDPSLAPRIQAIISVFKADFANLKVNGETKPHGGEDLTVKKGNYNK